MSWAIAVCPPRRSERGSLPTICTRTAPPRRHTAAANPEPVLGAHQNNDCTSPLIALTEELKNISAAQLVDTLSVASHDGTSVAVPASPDPDRARPGHVAVVPRRMHVVPVRRRGLRLPDAQRIWRLRHRADRIGLSQASDHVAARSPSNPQRAATRPERP